jgi:hypothetical protein
MKYTQMTIRSIICITEMTRKMAKQMGRYFDASYSPKEVNLYEPVSYTYFTPDTCHSKEYDDPKEFEKDLLKNTFTMKKYFFKYYERLNTRTI